MSAQGTETGSPGWQERARAAAAREAEVTGKLLRELVVFTLDADPYAVPVERVREIVRLRPITAVPRVADEIRGVISLRGQMVQVLDLRRRLGLAPARPDRRARIIVLHGDEGDVAALLVDSVSSVLRIAEEEILPPPGGEAPFVSGLLASDQGFVSLMDLDRVVDLDAA